MVGGHPRMSLRPVVRNSVGEYRPRPVERRRGDRPRSWFECCEERDLSISETTLVTPEQHTLETNTVLLVPEVQPAVGPARRERPVYRVKFDVIHRIYELLVLGCRRLLFPMALEREVVA